MNAMPRNVPSTFDILGAGAGGPLPPPSPWSQFSGFLSYGGGVVIGTPTGGAQGAGSLNLQTLFLNGAQFLPSNYLPLIGGTLTGPLLLAADPTAAFGAATKGYVDTRAWQEAPNDGSRYVRRNQAWALDPIQADAPNDAANYIRKSQAWALDPIQADAPNDASTYGRHANAWTAVLTPAAAASTYLPLAGGILTGPLTLAADPAAALQPATKQYTDARAWQEAPTDGKRYVRISSSWSPDPIQADAPADASLYARQNNAWVVIPAGPGGASRTAVGDVNYPILPTDKYVVTSAGLTAPRTWTLPLANSLPPGSPLICEDAAAVCTVTNTVSVVRNGTDTINNSASPLVFGSGIRQGATLYTDGVSNWSYAARAPQRLDGATIGATTPGSGAFTTLSATGNATFNGAGAVITIKPTGAGTVIINPAATGTLDNVLIGSLAPVGGTFTTLSATGNATFNGAGATISLQPTGTGTVTINPATQGTMNRMAIGGSVPSTGAFTTLSTTGTATIGANLNVSGIITATYNGASYAINGNNSSAANGAGGVIGQVGSTYGICGVKDSSGALWSFYGNGSMYISGSATIAGAMSISGACNASSFNATSGINISSGTIQWTTPNSFIIAYNGQCSMNIPSSSYFYLYFSGTPYYQFFWNQFWPSVDANTYLGVSSNRWYQVWAATGTIQTSDEREKKDIRELNEAEIRVAKRLKRLLVMYRWKDEVVKEDLRGKWHAGIIAQRVEAVFAEEGLDPDAYSMFREDELGELLEGESDAEGKVTKEPRFVPNGRTRYSVDYNQILAFIIAAL